MLQNDKAEYEIRLPQVKSTTYELWQIRTMTNWPYTVRLLGSAICWTATDVRKRFETEAVNLVVACNFEEHCVRHSIELVVARVLFEPCLHAELGRRCMLTHRNRGSDACYWAVAHPHAVAARKCLRRAPAQAHAARRRIRHAFISKSWIRFLA